MKSLIPFLDWFAGGALLALAFILMFTPYFASVLSNIGRRPVVLRARAKVARRLAARKRPEG